MCKREQWRWFKKQNDDPQEVSCYSLVAGNVLCRYWGEGERSEEAEIIEKAKKNYDRVHEAKFIIRGLLFILGNNWEKDLVDIAENCKFVDSIYSFLESK